MRSWSVNLGKEREKEDMSWKDKRKTNGECGCEGRIQRREEMNWKPEREEIISDSWKDEGVRRHKQERNEVED